MGPAYGPSQTAHLQVYRTQHRITIDEATFKIGTIHWVGLHYTSSRAVLFSEYRVERVGIEIDPLSYAEWVVRPSADSSVDTRTELVNQQDCVKYHNLSGKPFIEWYRPTDAINRGWQDVQNAVTTGLFLCLDGQNTLIEGPTGLIGTMVFDISWRGLKA